MEHILATLMCMMTGIEMYRSCTTVIICCVFFPIFQGLVCTMTVVLSDTEAVYCTNMFWSTIFRV